MSNEETMVKTSRSINRELQRQKREYYPPDERAGFNLGLSICQLIRTLDVDEVRFITGLIKPLDRRIGELVNSKERHPEKMPPRAGPI